MILTSYSITSVYRQSFYLRFYRARKLQLHFVYCNKKRPNHDARSELSLAIDDLEARAIAIYIYYFLNMQKKSHNVIINK